MATKRRIAARLEGPLTAEQLVKWENTAAAGEMPARWAEFLSHRRLELTVSERLKGELFEACRGQVAPNIRRWNLAPGVTIGMRGRKLERIDPRRVKARAAVENPAPHIPRWAPRIYHPTLSAPPFWARGPVERKDLRGELFWGVYQPEDRQVYYPSGYPWQCIGKVYAWNDINAASPSWWGSGVLIGPRHVLTAGHVVPWDGTAWAMQFIPAYYDGSPLNGPGASSWVSDARGWETSFRSRLPSGEDIAVLRLYDPLGDALGYFGAKTYIQQWNNLPEFYLMGYPAMIANAERPSYERRIAVLRDDENNGFAAIDHHGDSTGGDSGGPFWSFWSDGFPYAVGTVSGGYVRTDSNGNVVDDNNVAAGGSPMVNLINQARTDWH
jgi:Trypsin-like peptidase domain